MINIVKHQLLQNIPTALTESMIHKHFPIKCAACPIGNLSKRPLQHNSEEHQQRLLNPPAKGSEIELDIQGPWTDAKGKPCQTFNGCQYSLLAIDIASHYAFGHLIRTRGYLLRSIKHIHQEITTAGNNLTTIRCDSEFVTSEIQEYCASCTPPIELKGCIPYEHDTLPLVKKISIEQFANR